LQKNHQPASSLTHQGSQEDLHNKSFQLMRQSHQE
jgi:hypothetical protein